MRLIQVLYLAPICLLFSAQLSAHQPHDPITAVAASPNFLADQTAFAATDALSIKVNAYLLMKTTDGGASWSPVTGLPNNNKLLAIAFSPNYGQDQTIFVAGLQGLFGSTNQGTSWTQQAKFPVQAMAVSPNFALDRTLFFITTQKTILKSLDGGKTFITLNTPPSLSSGLTAIAISPDFVVDQILMIGTNDGKIYETIDFGITWNQVAQETSPIYALVFSPQFSSNQTIYAGSLGAGVLISNDAGVTWTPSNAGITDLNVTSIALSPNYTQDSTLWAATAINGVFESTTLGASWTQGAAVNRMFSPQVTVHYQSIAAAQGPNGVALFLAMFEGLWTSSPGIASWKYCDILPTRLIRYVHVSPNYTHDHTVFASTYGSGNLWTTTGGSTWTIQNTGMQSAYTDSSALSPNFAQDGTAFSSMGFYLQRSTDRGATWQQMQALGQVTYARGLAVSPNFAQDNTVLIGTDNQPGVAYPPFVIYNGKQYPNQGLFLSKDGGNTWIPTSLGGPPIISIAISPGFATDGTAFAASPGYGIYKSTDGGMTWNLITQPGNSKQPSKVAVSPSYSTDQTVFAALISGGFYKSTNGGSTWTLTPQTAGVRVLDIAVSPTYSADQTLFAGTVQYGLMKSTNGGAAFRQIPSFPDRFVLAVDLSPNFSVDKTIYAAGYNGLFKSAGGGSAWTYTDEPARLEDARNMNTSTDQQPPTVTYRGNWTVVTPAAAASSNSYEITSEAQDTATVQFRGSGIRWISWTGPSQGSASVQLDGQTEGQVSLTQPSDQYQQNVWEQHGILCGQHTFTVTALPQVGQTVSVDAFDIWLDTCPFSEITIH